MIQESRLPTPPVTQSWKQWFAAGCVVLSAAVRRWLNPQAAIRRRLNPQAVVHRSLHSSRSLRRGGCDLRHDLLVQFPSPEVQHKHAIHLLLACVAQPLLDDLLGEAVPLQLRIVHFFVV